MTAKKKDEAGEAQEFSLISNDTLLKLYGGLLKRQGSPKASIGKRRAQPHGWAFDAAAVAIANDLLSDDTVIAGEAAAVLGIFRGGISKDRRVSAAPGPEFSLELDRALGAALAHKTTKSGKVSVVFGGGQRGQVWTDALEIARAHRLPIVFVSELIESEVRGNSRSRKHDRASLEPGTELPHIVVDGNDVVASYRVAHEAIDRARRDRGPTLIECTAFRIGGRNQRNPIANMENYLRGKGLLTRGLKLQMLERAGRDSNSRKQ
jgi:hypothetical protein